MNDFILPQATPELSMLNRPAVIYTVRGEGGREYTFSTRGHYFGDMMAIHTAAGQTLVGIDGINGYKAPALSEATHAHDEAWNLVPVTMVPFPAVR